jgi:hypothetical protein
MAAPFLLTFAAMSVHQRALLVIADIGGYTRFMKVHRINLAHAQDIVGRLLEAVIDGAEPALTLAKLEGDAALLYALEGRGGVPSANDVVRSIRREFLKRQARLQVDRMCSCDGCTQVGALKLKFAVHVGEIAMQKVKSYRELAGMDVILVHRMLKNSVPTSEYMLMTEQALASMPETVRARAQGLVEDFEGVGPTSVHYVDLTDPEAEAEALARVKPNFFRALWAHILMNLRSLTYIIGAKKPCAVFRNMDVALGHAAPHAALPMLTGPDGKPKIRPSDIPPPNTDPASEEP